MIFIFIFTLTRKSYPQHYTTIIYIYFYIYIIVVVVGPVDKWITLVASDFFMLGYLGVNRLLEPLYPLSQISLLGYPGR